MIEISPTKIPFVFLIDEPIATTCNPNDMPKAAPRIETLWLTCFYFNKGNFIPTKESYDAAIKYVKKLKGKENE